MRSFISGPRFVLYRGAVNCSRRASTSAPTAASATLDFRAIDAKWHRRWADTPKSSLHAGHVDQGKAYVLPMFPYPSGTLHVGHLRVYTIADVLARFQHMRGHHVVHPMGWDAFGLPAENAAIERGIDPKTWTYDNIAKMKAQLRAMGGRWDWDREIVTCDPKFYKQTQRIFLLLHRYALAYQAEALVNYDPIDRTVLANEQVDAKGFSWRSGAKVERVKLKQWFLRITAFRDALYEGLDDLQGRWPEHVVTMQRNWLGKSTGARIRFAVTGVITDRGDQSVVEVYTTRPDTMFGVQYLALSARHPLVQKLARTSAPLQAFVDDLPSAPPDSKAGFLLSDVRARNPLADHPSSPDAVHAPIPIFVAPYVLDGYGDGAVMGVPGHDTRDYAFWKENMPSDPVQIVVRPQELDQDKERYSPRADTHEPYPHHGVLTVSCGPFAGRPSIEAGHEIVSLLHQRQQAEPAESWRLRDWLISRQRYWGTPIPIIHCEDCGAVPVPDDQLPVELPDLRGDQLSSQGGNPLASRTEWVTTTCPSCGGAARRETDTMDTFVDSSWYYLRFADPRNEASPCASDKITATLPVDLYVGGVEHAILHLLYARFIYKFLSTTPLWPPHDSQALGSEPFTQLISQGMVHGKTYSHPHTGRFLKPLEVDLSDASTPRLRDTGEVATVSWEKMSKSKHNGVDPNACIARYGADATRAHILFQAPISEVLEWDEGPIVGIHRWFRRVWRVTLDAAAATGPERNDEPAQSIPNPDLAAAERSVWTEVQRSLTDITTSLDRTYALNTVVSSLTKLTNALASTSPNQISPTMYRDATSILLRMMAPVAPAFAEECWERLHRDMPRPDSSPGAIASIHDAPWPEVDGSRESLQGATQKCAVQVNGKLKFAVDIAQPPPSPGSDDAGQERVKQWIIERLLETDVGKKWLRERHTVEKASRVIMVRGGKTMNFVF